MLVKTAGFYTITGIFNGKSPKPIGLRRFFVAVIHYSPFKTGINLLEGWDVTFTWVTVFEYVKNINLFYILVVFVNLPCFLHRHTKRVELFNLLAV